MSDWVNRIIGEGEVAPDQLLANPLNFRVHPRGQRDALEGVLDQVGYIQRVIVNQTTGHVIDGHLRVESAISKGQETIPVVYVELTEDEERLVLATFDPLGALAGQDAEVLADLLSQVEADDEAVQALLDEMIHNDSKQATEHPEMEITPLFMEKSDYIVLVFDNEIDWTAAVDTFGIKRVLAPNSRGKNHSSGIGHVVNGAAIVQRLNGDR